MNKLTFFFLLCFAIFFCACKEEPIGGDIENTYWNLTSIKQGTKVTNLSEGSEISAIFSKAKVSGISTCNRYSADFSVEETALSVSSMISTERMCDAINLEQAYLNLLSKATGYSVKETGLVVFAEGGQLDFSPMSNKEIADINYAEGVGKLITQFPEMEGDAATHFYPIVRVDRPGNYPYKGQLIDPSLYTYFDPEMSEIWNNTGGDVLAVGKSGDFFVCRIPGRYVSSDIALFRLENGVLKRKETVAWAWCDEGWCNQQDAWLRDINKDGRMDIVQHYTLTDDKGKIREERMTTLLQNDKGEFLTADNIELDMQDFKMADI